ncbi:MULTISPECIES: SusC/RagA family TonB-linked outer membrane protein [Butyricimonas]|uniref:SusC/RagA family TonB-linked outer membrane protein n=1 Tax=Butyricimonas TaxID=574697 RepID=UPI0007FB3C2C|nr:TonB-dependent receptor [Butyricimonas synergistica]
MKKRRNCAWRCHGKSWRKMLMFMKLLSVLLFGVCMSVSASVLSQNARVTVDMRNVALTTVLEELGKQSKCDFFYNYALMQTKGMVSVKAENRELGKVLEELLPGLGLAFTFDRNVVVIREKVDDEKPKSVRVKGYVFDKQKQSMPGVTVKVAGLTIGTSTNAQGWFALDLPMTSGTLEFTFIGFKKKTLDFTEKMAKDTLRVTMEEDVQELDETVVVAFGQQKKESVVSAITTVRPMDLKSSSSDLTTSFAGKIAGIVGWQTGGLPGALTEEEMNTKFYIRGITSFQTGANIDPLILIDGVESSKLDLARMAPEDIESFSVMKDAAATAMYGARGANGVILVTTKKGEEGSVYTSVRYEAVASMPTKKLDIVDPVTYMRMYNEALMARDPLATPRYSALDISRRQNKSFPSWAYPANDWMDILFKDYSINHRLGVNIRGGSKVMQYYASVNYVRDMGMLKTDRLNEFDVNIKNSTLSFRVNLNVNLHRNIKLLYNSQTNWDKYHGPKESVAQAYKMALEADPVRFAPTYPADMEHNWEHILFGAFSETGQENPYMQIHAGYLERNRYSTTNQLEYIHNLSSLVKGLELRARVALSQSGYYSMPFSTKPYFYRLQSFDEPTGVHKLFALNPSSGDRTIDLNADGKQAYMDTRLTYELRAYHTAAWGDHQTSLTAVLNAMESTSSAPEKYLEAVEHRNLGFSMRGTYGFKDRYFVEASFGYNGSERFAKKNKMGFFPAAGVAYVISSEPFMAGTANWLPFLKLRASYGKVGNDGIINTPRFVHLPEVVDSGMNSQQPGETSTKGWKVNNYANENIKWEIAEQVNVGLEAKLFKGIGEFTLDVYQEIRHNILSYRTVIPAHVGVESLQLDNIGKVRSRGLDFSGKIQHAFSPDLWIILNGTFTYNKATYMSLEEASDTPEWQRKTGHEISQQVGFIDQGLFRDAAEVAAAPKQNGQYGPGDIRYRDVNNDGIIDIKDAVHIGFPETPRITYGFSGFINYKGWEFNFAFQGSGKRGFFINPRSISPFYSGNVLQAIADDHWTPGNMKNHPLWPRLSVQNIAYHNQEEGNYEASYSSPTAYKSTYFMRECSFLRCTALELAYNLPDTWKRKIRMQNVKVFVRANNPFIITNFKLWDVELGGNGFNYPIQKTYAIGLNFSF